ncbi:MAG TPA: peptide chain release factor 2 [Candidatus Magasanikbacteria bacterium]|nr:peptide chain release factor 2 [Candidatus Magasanikbacteria bacterium]
MADLKSFLAKIKEAQGLLKIGELKAKMKTLGDEMNASGFWDNPNRAKVVAQEYEGIKEEIDKWESLEKRTLDLIELSEVGDSTLADEIESQFAELQKEFEKNEFFLLFDGPHDKNNAIITFHAGSGGTEAQDWAEMLARMVSRFAEKMDWKVTILSESRGQEAGIKSLMVRVVGRYAYGYLKSEHGTHRLVRISPFDAEKMRHTSFAGIEVLPEIEEGAEVDIDPKDLRIDTFMSGGKGGQSVNTTYSAVRIVHVPTGVTVQCQNERSQMQNKEVAMRILQSKLQKMKEEEELKKMNDLRGEYKSAEWGNQIRSYVLHPYHLVKDLRSDYESTDPESVLEGELLPLSEAYLRWCKKK